MIGNCPIVTSTLNSPLATLSVTSSISASSAPGSFSFSYVLLNSPAAFATAVGATVAAPIGVTRLGWSEKRLGERTRKSRC